MNLSDKEVTEALLSMAMGMSRTAIFGQCRITYIMRHNHARYFTRFEYRRRDSKPQE
ncbi:MAG: hypothetical protein ACI8T6_000352 [Candidatus Poseidoniaceae archaeon]|jgi:hypothetical protein